LQCISRATTGISRSDWFSTSANTNIAESAHAQSQREGIRLSLVAAIQKGMRLDARYFESELAQISSGISVKYGNTSMTGRAKQNITRKKKKAKQKGKEKETRVDESVLALAQDLIQSGVSATIVDAYLTSKINKK
jgi:hypothetical protein